MKTLLLHPIYHGFDNSMRDSTKQVYEFSPDHLPWLLRHEYKFLRQEGTTRRMARWHVHRMIVMLSQPLGWSARLADIWPEEEDLGPLERLDSEGNLIEGDWS